MEALIAYARDWGLKTLWGMVEAGNHPMLDLARDLGFAAEPCGDETSIRATLTLN